MMVVMGVSASVFAALFHACLVRWLPARFYMSAIGLCGVVSLTLVVLVAALAGISLTWQQWLFFACLVPSLLAGYALLFVGIVWDSPTLALANEIADHGSGGMPRQCIEGFVHRHPFVRSRLDAMMASGVLTDDGKVFAFRKDVGLMIKFADIYRRIGSRRGAAG